ncbi:hypothetical protein [Vibrio coralliilyticus]|uniref:hypothetical protein n=1 Tax=Vibrio coralliilyticus TaxID=190893 RepID=UPI0002D5FA6A|nr:hypothetical protein [Vibrio coralliilyticus]
MISFEFYDLLMLLMFLVSAGFVYVAFIEGAVFRALSNLGIAAFCAFGLYVRLLA